MANVKGRVKSKSGTPNRGHSNPKKSLTGQKNASDLTNNVKEKSVLRKAGDLIDLQKKFMHDDTIDFNKCTEKTVKLFHTPKPHILRRSKRQPRPRVRNEARKRRKAGDLTALQQVLMQNDAIDFNKCTEKFLKLNQLPKPRILRSSSRKPEIENPSRMYTQSGQVAGKCSKGLKMIDNILKGELMIEIEMPTKIIEKTVVTTVTNNNEMGISDQNDTINLPNPQPIHEKKNKTQVKNTIKSNNHAESSNYIGIQTRSKLTLPINNENTKNPITKSKTKNSTINKKITQTKNSEQKIKRRKQTDKAVKTKQVTLSNGLVLTLALFQCDYCQKMFSSKASLRRHMYIHLKLEQHCCKMCSKKFRYKMHLHNHVSKHHQDMRNLQPMLCQICDKQFLLQENLELHLSTHIKNENSFKCVYCDKKFSYHLLLTQHEKQHLITGKYQCSVCQLSFDTINRLKFHMKTHLKIKDYICQHCGKEFLRMNSLRRHVQICHSGHRLQCPVCNKKLKGHLTEHMRTHKQARPHECDLCGQRFTQSTQLTVHKRCHTGERPFGCKICHRYFTHSNSLMLHIRRHTGEKPFRCTVCPLSFSQLPHMKTHLIKIHKRDTPYKCQKCYACFKMKKQVDSHEKNCKVGDRELTFEEKIQASVQVEEIEVPSPMSISRMRYLLALLLTMVANKKSLKFLGFNKRPIEELLLETIEAIGQTPCKDTSLSPIIRLKTNIRLLLEGTIPSYQMEKFEKEHKTTEEILEILTDEKKA